MQSPGDYGQVIVVATPRGLTSQYIDEEAYNWVSDALLLRNAEQLQFPLIQEFLDNL
jgi:hypothetical protein